jgi:hypothetical protein
MRAAQSLLLITSIAGTLACTAPTSTPTSTPSHSVSPATQPPSPVTHTKPPAPKGTPMNYQAVARDIAAGRACASPADLRETYLKHAETLYLQRRFQELDKFLDLLAQRDPLETLCTPTSVVDLLLYDKHNLALPPWKLHLAELWAQKHPKGWSELALVSALCSRGEVLKASVQYKHLPAFELGSTFLDRAVNMSADVPQGKKGKPFFDYVYGFVTGQTDALTGAILKDPREIALYNCLVALWVTSKAEQRSQYLERLATRPDTYALFFTVLSAKYRVEKMEPDSWDWPTLHQGFDALLRANPKAIEVRNAFALAANHWNDAQLRDKQLALLGWQWDLRRWGSLENYQSTANYFNAQSTHPAATPVTGVQDLKLTAVTLLNRAQFQVLEQLIRALPKQAQREEVYDALSTIEPKDPKEFERRDKLMSAWVEQSPQSAEAHTALADFYISYAWLARGNDYAGTVSEADWDVFGKRLERTAEAVKRAEELGGKDIRIARCQMTVCLGADPDPKQAQAIALKASSRGDDARPVMKDWSNFLLPRWHGEPGDLTKAADTLRKKTGHDKFYAPMAVSTIQIENVEALESGAVQWERLVNSVVAAGKDGPELTKQELLQICEDLQKQKDAARILPLASAHYLADVWTTDDRYQACRAWAAGKGAWPQVPFQLDWQDAPKKQKVAAGVQLGFFANLTTRRPGTTIQGTMRVQSPGIATDDGTRYDVFELPVTVFPTDPPIIQCVVQLNRPEELVPGKWTISYREVDKELHSATFELTP